MIVHKKNTYFSIKLEKGYKGNTPNFNILIYKNITN